MSKAIVIVFTFFVTLGISRHAHCQQKCTENCELSKSALSIANTNKNATVRYGDEVALTLTGFFDSISVDDVSQCSQWRENVVKAYPIINSIHYPQIKLTPGPFNVESTGVVVMYKDKDGKCYPDDPSKDRKKIVRTIYKIAVTFQGQLSEIYEKTSDTTRGFTKLWRNSFDISIPNFQIKFSLNNVVGVESNEITFINYPIGRMAIGAIIFVGVLVLLFYYGSKNKWNMLRDDDRSNTRKPFSLSRVQIFFWTCIIFPFATLIWAATGAFPPITASHLVLLGIVAGQRILAQLIDSGSRNEKNNFLATADDKCTFFSDLISDNTGLSITRLQYVIATIIFMGIFINNAFANLELTSFSIMQLGLMGTSAGLYLWNKQLDQQKAPFDLNIELVPGNLEGDTLEAFKSQPPSELSALLDNAPVQASHGDTGYAFVIRSVIPGKHNLLVSSKVKIKDVEIKLQGQLDGDLGAAVPKPQYIKMNKV